MRTHYHNLMIQENADPAIIKASYKVLAQRYHPDRNPENAKEAKRIFQIVTVAYETLSDPNKRAVYDAKLRAARDTASGGKPRRAAQAPSPPPNTSERVNQSSSNPEGLVELVTNTQIAKRLRIMTKLAADNPNTPKAIKWLLYRPVHLVVVVQGVVALYLFRDVIF
ncbi:J domain-containing protein (plasmid) [Pseudomonas amygdali pv. lachrymans]|uniref:J domain-containing protein n=1 Tax=Pseudomonas amygdali TaxID=47877 RepID=UPI0009BE90F5|nr:J domain-containing protein [Pseudomonas amygdali]RMM39066.1 hypothetical protein ALQ79_200657 [Pseudomonas amygdali pv. lachrymans]WIO61561.1 J domain-containing protein [Pseudomonas amygdali pv. lachrymans]